MLKTLSLMGYIGMVGTLLGLLVTRSLFAASPLVIGLQGAAMLLLVWARVTYGRRSYHVVADPTEGGLVTGGPYLYIRHPIYAAMCLFSWAGVVAHWSWSSGLWGGLMLGSAVMRIFCEESLVTARYPEYAQYKARTWRMVLMCFSFPFPAVSADQTSARSYAISSVNARVLSVVPF